MTNPVRDFGSWLVKQLVAAYVLGPLLLILPPIVLVTVAKEFVATNHVISGWAVLALSPLIGLFVASLWFNILHWRSERRRRRRNLIVVGRGGPGALHWQMGKSGTQDVMIVAGHFDITNLTSGDLTIPKVFLEVSCPILGFIPRRRRFDCFGLPDAVIQGEHTLVDSFFLWPGLPPIIRRQRPLRARVAIVDNFGLENWSRWDRWEFM